MAKALRNAAPWLVVGEGIVAPLMALCLRTQGLHAHLLQRKPVKQTIDQGSVVLTPRTTNFLTEDLELQGARPPGNMVTNFYSYDNKGNVLMNLNLDSLRADDSGTFFCCQREVIERLLVRECEKPAGFLKHKNPVVVHSRGEKATAATTTIRKITTPPGGSGVTVHYSNGRSQNYKGIINVSRDMDAVPLISGNGADVEGRAKRQDLSDHVKRATDNIAAPFFLDWTIPVRQGDSWELHYDELGEIVHRAGRRIFVRPTSGKEFSICMTIPRRAPLESTQSSAKHFAVIKQFWESLDPIAHPLWNDGILPGLQNTVTGDHKKVNYVTPTYCHEDWLEEGGRYIRVGPAAHAATAQPVDVADAIDFEDCFQLAEHIAEHGNAELGEWCANRRLDVVDAMNEIAVLDDISRTARSPMSFSLKRMYYTFSKTFSRSYKRALRPYS